MFDEIINLEAGPKLNLVAPLSGIMIDYGTNGHAVA